jgi:nucleoside-diphosphate-sugar epimerase
LGQCFGTTSPHLAFQPHVELVEGDVRAPHSLAGTFDGVVHAATPASADLNNERPYTMLETIYRGGQTVLELAARSGKIPLLFTSSGAVYGLQPPDLDAMPETYGGAPDPLIATNAYHEGKRLGELQCAIAARTLGLRVKIARLFAFVGPYLPLDRHFAIGNFIRDGMAGRTISVAGDGTAVRSYLYSADMVSWLWAIFVRGEVMRAYNVGAAAPISIEELAHAIARRFSPSPDVSIGRKNSLGNPPHRYVPDVRRIKSELSVRESVDITSAIARTIENQPGLVR